MLMNKTVVNKKMEIVKKFFHISNNDINIMLERNVISEESNFVNLKIEDILKLTRKLNLSLDILEEIFCTMDTNTYSLAQKLRIYRTQGIVRKIDDLGRIVLPMEQRNFLHILEKDPLEVTLDFNGNFLLKPGKKCITCGRLEDIIEINEMYLCEHCLNNYQKKIMIT